MTWPRTSPLPRSTSRTPPGPGCGGPRAPAGTRPSASSGPPARTVTSCSPPTPPAARSRGPTGSGPADPSSWRSPPTRSTRCTPRSSTTWNCWPSPTRTPSPARRPGNCPAGSCVRCSSDGTAPNCGPNWSSRYGTWPMCTPREGSGPHRPAATSPRGPSDRTAGSRWSTRARSTPTRASARTSSGPSRACSTGSRSRRTSPSGSCAPPRSTRAARPPWGGAS